MIYPLTLSMWNTLSLRTPLARKPSEVSQCSRPKFVQDPLSYATCPYLRRFRLTNVYLEHLLLYAAVSRPNAHAASSLIPIRANGSRWNFVASYATAHTILGVAITLATKEASSSTSDEPRLQFSSSSPRAFLVAITNEHIMVPRRHC